MQILKKSNIYKIKFISNYSLLDLSKLFKLLITFINNCKNCKTNKILFSIPFANSKLLTFSKTRYIYHVD